MTTPPTPESGRHTTLRAGDRVRHWSEGYTGIVTAIVPMDEPLPDYCTVDVAGADGQPPRKITCPHNQLVRGPEPKPEPDSKSP